MTTILKSIGGTGLIELANFALDTHFPGRLFAKRESANPFGSIKDRVALAMLEVAEADGRLSPGGTIVEPTSGNTGIALAGVGAVKGYRVILTMPDTMSEERRNLLLAHGAELVLTEGRLGMAGAMAKARELAAAIPGSFIPDQFSNLANPQAHYRGTGPEIWNACQGVGGPGGVDIFVAGVGTGGTLTGVGRYLRERNPGVKLYAVEPADSPVLSGGKAGPHGLQGIGAGFVPEVLDRGLMDGVLPVTLSEARAAVRAVARSEGFLVGISSGAALAGVLALAARGECEGKTLATVLPDSGERYLSTGLFAPNK